MKIMAMLLGAMFAGGAVQGTQPEQSMEQTVTVCITMVADVEMQRAVITASQMFAEIGVRIDLRPSRRSCPAGPDPILISLVTGRPVDLCPRALAFARP